MGAKAGAIILVLIVLGIVIFIAVEMNVYNDINLKFKEGCRPTAWNQFGQPTYWRCPGP